MSGMANLGAFDMEQQTLETKIMSGICIGIIEWTFGTIIIMFVIFGKGGDFLVASRQQYTLSAFLVNCGDKLTAHFNCRAPTLDQYLED